GGGVGAGLLLDHFDAVALRPNLELFDSGCAESVGGAKHDLQALFAQAIGQLADTGGLASAVHADDENDTRAVAVARSQRCNRSARGVENPRDVRFDLAPELRRVRERVAIELFADCVEDLAGGTYAEIGREKRRFQLFEQRRIDLGSAEKNRI